MDIPKDILSYILTTENKYSSAAYIKVFCKDIQKELIRNRALDETLKLSENVDVSKINQKYLQIFKRHVEARANEISKVRLEDGND